LPPWRCGLQGLNPWLRGLVSYDRFAEEAASRMTPEYIKRGKRIQKAGATEMLIEARQLFERGVRRYGASAARDVFQQAADIAVGQTADELPLPPRPKGKQKGAHEPERDRLLLKAFNEKDGNSPWSLAKRGELPGTSKPMTKKKFAGYFLTPWWGYENCGGSKICEHKIGRNSFLISSGTN